MQFSRLVMSEKVLRRLLKQDVVVSISLSDPNCRRTLYERGKPANYFILVVEGHVQIHIGTEDFVFDGGPFMYFGAQALTGSRCLLIFTVVPLLYYLHYVCYLYSSSSSFLACNSRLRSAIHRHHPPQRVVLSQICCIRERKVVLFQILLDGAEPRDTGTT